MSSIFVIFYWKTDGVQTNDFIQLLTNKRSASISMQQGV